MFYIEYYEKKHCKKKPSYGQFYFFCHLDDDVISHLLIRLGGQQITNSIYFKSFTECFL